MTASTVVIVDLNGLRSSEEVLLKFGEVFELGGPNGNHPPKRDPANNGSGWGINWNALDDCLYSIADGGIWGMSKRFQFPLTIEIHNFRLFSRSDPEGFAILQDVLEKQASRHTESGMTLRIAFTTDD